MIDRKDDNFGKRMIPEPDLNYLQQVIKNNPDPQDVGRGTAVTYDAGEGIKIPDNKTIEIDTDIVALKEDIPTVGNGIITIQVNGETVDSFGVNRSTNKTVNIPVESGGTTVVANPTVTTDTLNSIQIGNVGYALPMMFTLQIDYNEGVPTANPNENAFQLTQGEFNAILDAPMINLIHTGTGYSYMSGCYLLGRRLGSDSNTRRVFYHDGYINMTEMTPSRYVKLRVLSNMSQFSGEPGVAIQ